MTLFRYDGITNKRRPFHFFLFFTFLLFHLFTFLLFYLFWVSGFFRLAEAV